jgi:hypothetical protein
MRIFKTTTSIKDDGEDEDEPVKKSIFATCPVEKKKESPSHMHPRYTSL